ncbi:MAG: cytochrome P450 [Pirellulales bacterium]
MDFSSEDFRRNPYPVYDQIRSVSPVFREPQSGLWMIFDYEGVKRALADHEAFSSEYGPDWLIFSDPPRHTKLRVLVSQAFTPRSIAGLEGRIRELARELLDQTIERGEMDLAADFAIPLPMIVIAEMLGIPVADRERFKRWSDAILNMSYTIAGSTEAARAANEEFLAVTVEMNAYLADLLDLRRSEPKDDLLTRLARAEMDGERLTQEEILGFFQLLLLAGNETTTNLLNNAVLCFIENPDELDRLRRRLDLLPSAIEEIVRYRSPLQWIGRVTKREVEMHGEVIPAGTFVLVMIGAANRDPEHFRDPNRFDITRDPNPHLAFGHGVHFCLGAPLARLEAKIALGHLLERLQSFELASDEPWPPRTGLHVLGPSSLPIRFQAASRAAALARV